jgi:hypothetical protein
MTDTAAPSAVNREAVRAEIEAARTGFHELLASLSPDDFKKKSANSGWSNGQLCWHIAWAIGFLPGGVQRSRTGKNLNLPRGLYNVINPIYTRWSARGATPEKVARSYDDAHAKLLATLETIRDDEWDKGAKIAGTYETVADQYKIPMSHLEEHRADILKGLGRV